jgi:hypothetical protein
VAGPATSKVSHQPHLRSLVVVVSDEFPHRVILVIIYVETKIKIGLC